MFNKPSCPKPTSVIWLQGTRQGSDVMFANCLWWVLCTCNAESGMVCGSCVLRVADILTWHQERCGPCVQGQLHPHISSILSSHMSDASLAHTSCFASDPSAGTWASRSLTPASWLRTATMKSSGSSWWVQPAWCWHTWHVGWGSSCVPNLPARRGQIFMVRPGFRDG